jgi:hypothetical protein
MARPAPEQRQLPPIVLENRRIHFRNFAGAEGRFNNAGNRNFVVFLDTEEAEAMEKDGWPIRWLEPRDEDDGKAPILKVRVKWPKEGSKGRPPRVVLITGNGKTNLSEEMVSLLDWADIENVDLIVRAYHYDISGKTGVSAYVNSMYVTIREDELEKKYRDVPDSAAAVTVANEEETPPWE